MPFASWPDCACAPTAIICSSDVSAIDVMREPFDFGLRIPQDLSLMGLGDIRLAQFMIPP